MTDKKLSKGERFKDESGLNPWQKGAQKMWERRRAEGLGGTSTPESIARTVASKKEQKDALLHLFNRLNRLEAVLRTYGFSDEEIRNM